MSVAPLADVCWFVLQVRRHRLRCHPGTRVAAQLPVQVSLGAVWGVFLVFFWCFFGVFLVFFWCFFFVCLFPSQAIKSTVHCREPRDQAIWGLANIAGDGPLARDAVLEHGALELFLQLVLSVESLYLVRTLVWAISNLCRYHNPPPPMDKVAGVLVLARGLLYAVLTHEVCRSCSPCR
jgi:hypothetical protein